MPTSGHDELRIRLDLRPLDLASLATLRTFADGFLEDHDTLDVLIANAGIMACPYGTTVDGFELQWGTNHLGHFLLITRLLPALWKTIPQGAATSVDAATSPDLDGRGGVNLEDCHIAEIAHDPAATDGVRAYALDPAITDALWAYSEQAVAA